MALLSFFGISLKETLVLPVLQVAAIQNET